MTPFRDLLQALPEYEGGFLIRGKTWKGAKSSSQLSNPNSTLLGQYLFNDLMTTIQPIPYDEELTMITYSPFLLPIPENRCTTVLYFFFRPAKTPEEVTLYDKPLLHPEEDRANKY